MMKTNRSSFSIIKSVIFSLLIVELQVKTEKKSLGYLWMLIEPAAHVYILLTLFLIVDKTIYIDLDPLIFIITGIVPWLMFRNIILKSTFVLKQNVPLLNYKTVKPSDPIIARFIFEIFTHINIYILLLFAAKFIGHNVVIYKIDILIITWLLFLIFCCSIGILVAILGCIFDHINRFIKIFFRPLYFISGIFFSLEVIPANYREYFLINPIIHYMELFRFCFCRTCLRNYTDIYYLIIINIILLFFALLLYRFNSKSLLLKVK